MKSDFFFENFIGNRKQNLAQKKHDYQHGNKGFHLNEKVLRLSKRLEEKILVEIQIEKIIKKIIIKCIENA